MNMRQQRDQHLCRAIEEAIRADAAQGSLREVGWYIRRVVDTHRPPYYYVEPDQAMRMMQCIRRSPIEYGRHASTTRDMWLEIYRRYIDRVGDHDKATRQRRRRALHMALLTRPSQYFVTYDRARRIYNQYHQIS